MPDNRFPPEDDAEELAPSKSQRKREAHEMFDLGRELSELSSATLRELPMDDDVLEAVLFAKSIRSHGARKRQLGFLAKLLRNTDTEPLLEALEARLSAARAFNARHHRAEAWRDALLAPGTQSLETLLDARHDIDVQALRQLVRNAQSESLRGKPPASARKLFRMLRELDETAALPALPEPAA
jgi:ribosome-associated protein